MASLGKPVLAADEAAQVADQRAVRDQRALRRAGGAAGVDEHGRVVGARAHRAEAGCARAAAPRPSRGRPALAASPTAMHRRAAPGRPRARRAGWRSSSRRRSRRAPRCRSAGTRAHRGRTASTAASPPHRADSRPGAPRPSRRAAASRSRPGRRAARPAARARAPAGSPAACSAPKRQVSTAPSLVLDDDRHRLRRAARPARTADLGDVEPRRHAPAEVAVQLGVAVGGGAARHAASVAKPGRDAQVRASRSDNHSIRTRRVPARPPVTNPERQRPMQNPPLSASLAAHQGRPSAAAQHPRRRRHAAARARPGHHQRGAAGGTEGARRLVRPQRGAAPPRRRSARRDPSSCLRCGGTAWKASAMRCAARSRSSSGPPSTTRQCRCSR